MGGAGAAGVCRDLHLSRRHRATGSPFRASGSSWPRGGGSGREAGGRLCTQVSGPCTPGCPPGRGQRGRGWDPVALLCSGRAGRGQEPRSPLGGASLRWLGTLGGRSCGESVGAVLLQAQTLPALLSWLRWMSDAHDEIGKTGGMRPWYQSSLGCVPEGVSGSWSLSAAPTSTAPTSTASISHPSSAISPLPAPPAGPSAGPG